MWTVKKPAHSAEEAFEICISRIRDPALLARMESIADTVAVAAEEYEARAETADLHLFAPANAVGAVSAKEMEKVYTGRMVPKKSPGRPIYNAILALAKHGRCPFCGHRVVSTLDHLLAKTLHPVFAVTPSNLAPSCSDCNKAKLDQSCATAADQYLHPYFDDVEDDLWLKAEILETKPASARFFVDPHEEWSQLTTQRVENHFRQLGLARLYASQAADEIIGIQFQVAQLFHRAGVGGVRAFLTETHESRSNARINSWQTAVYAALSESDWYCQGGFA